MNMPSYPSDGDAESGMTGNGAGTILLAGAGALPRVRIRIWAQQPWATRAPGQPSIPSQSGRNIGSTDFLLNLRQPASTQNSY
ncbi:hypothetical protein VP1G_10594 [Cytospora mali]|uniref:Uncharacterized protein n=1 Tax=Cytospora mali TaxID=578113 RepID=A0A194UPT1_CYTMA|nr:hypothetical protein VP1G_10594 [Valsa mali var. pyri (nom. inval.)]